MNPNMPDTPKLTLQQLEAHFLQDPGKPPRFTLRQLDALCLKDLDDENLTVAERKLAGRCHQLLLLFGLVLRVIRADRRRLGEFEALLARAMNEAADSGEAEPNDSSAPGSQEDPTRVETPAAEQTAQAATQPKATSQNKKRANGVTP